MKPSRPDRRGTSSRRMGTQFPFADRFRRIRWGFGSADNSGAQSGPSDARQPTIALAFCLVTIRQWAMGDCDSANAEWLVNITETSFALNWGQNPAQRNWRLWRAALGR